MKTSFAPCLCSDRERERERERERANTYEKEDHDLESLMMPTEEEALEDGYSGGAGPYCWD